MSRVEPASGRELARAAPHLVVLSVPMGLLRAGRGVCVVAQRFPPAVAVVRRVRGTASGS